MRSNGGTGEGTRGRSDGPPHVGLTFPGAGNASTTWSGIPKGLADGFRELGLPVRHISTELPLLTTATTAALALLRAHRVRGGKPLHRLRRSKLAVSEASRELAVLRSAVAALRCRGVPIDALVQVGTGYDVPGVAPLATLEDTTIPQAMQLGVEPWAVQPPGVVAARMARQLDAYSRATACCTASTWAARSIVDEYGVPAAKVHVVGFGRNLEPRPARRDWTTPRFLFVGLDWERKGGPTLLRAFERLRRLVPLAELDVVGRHPRLDLPGVTGRGWLDPADSLSRRRLEGLFERATCFVMPSRFEPFGIVHVEAGAAGIPSIGTSVGGATDAIGPGAGRVVAYGDERKLRDAMLELANPGVATRMGEAAHRHAAGLTWRAVASRIARALDLVTPDGPVGSSTPGYAADWAEAAARSMAEQSR